MRAGLVTLSHGAPALTFYDNNGKNRAELALTREGAPALTITLTKADEMIFAGKEQDGFVQVETSKGAGWVKKILITK